MTMEKYIGKKAFREIMSYIMCGLGAALVLMGIVFTILAAVSTDENNDMMDFATIGYSFGVICLIIFLVYLLSGALDRPKQFKRCMKMLKDRGLLETAQKEFEQAKDKSFDCLLTLHFLYLKGKGMVIPVEDMAWVHLQQINLSRAGGNGTPMNFRPWIYDIYGNEFTTVYLYDPKKYEIMKNVLNYTKKFNPNIVLGYSKEMEKAYKEKYKKNNK